MDFPPEELPGEGPVIDPAYEFCAPQYFDFSKAQDEMDEEAMQADAWFDRKTVPDEFSPQVVAKQTTAMHEGGSAKPLTRSTTKMSAAKDASKTPLQDRTNLQGHMTFLSPAQHKSVRKAAAVGQTPASESRTPAVSQQPEASASEHRPLTRSMAKTDKDTVMVDATEKPVSPELLPAKRLYSDLQWGEQIDPKTLKKISSQAGRLEVPSEASNAAKSIESAERAQKRRKVSNDRLKEILGSRGPVLPPRSAAPLTIPQEVHFATEERAHLRGDSPMELRNGKFVSLAESVQKFQSKTPTRFHSKPRSQERPRPGPKVNMPLTRPVGPQFLTDTRVRTTRVKSSAELEEEEIASMPRFKARPFSDKVRRGEHVSFSKPAQASVTHPEEFHLLTDQRAKLRSHTTDGDQAMDAKVSQAEVSQSKFDPLRLTKPKSPQLSTAYRARPTKATSTEEAEVESVMNHPKFKARPLDRRILESCGEMGVPKVVPAPTTKAEGFQLATDSRLGRHPSELPALPARKRQALELTTHEYELRPRAHVTQPEPFPLRTEDRGTSKRAEFMQRMIAQEEAERAQREHRAQPLPYTTDYPAVPRKPPTKEPTEPEPFPLESVWRHEIEMAERNRRLEEQARREKQQHQFKAQPNLSRGVQPFVPAPSSVPPTEFEELRLETERRARERAEFDTVVEEKERMAEEYFREMQEQMKAMDQKVLKELRREMVPKARPVPSFDKPFVPQRSMKGPTVPVSPPITRAQHRDASAAKGFSMR